MKEIIKRIISTAAAGIILFGAACSSGMQAFAYSEAPVNAGNYDMDSEVTNFIGAKTAVSTSEIGSGLTVTYHIYSFMTEGFASCKVAKASAYLPKKE